jgi:hypothetical protein
MQFPPGPGSGVQRSFVGRLDSIWNPEKTSRAEAWRRGVSFSAPPRLRASYFFETRNAAQARLLNFAERIVRVRLPRHKRHSVAK